MTPVLGGDNWGPPSLDFPSCPRVDEMRREPRLPNPLVLTPQPPLPSQSWGAPRRLASHPLCSHPPASAPRSPRPGQTQGYSLPNLTLFPHPAAPPQPQPQPDPFFRSLPWACSSGQGSGRGRAGFPPPAPKAMGGSCSPEPERAQASGLPAPTPLPERPCHLLTGYRCSQPRGTTPALTAFTTKDAWGRRGTVMLLITCSVKRGLQCGQVVP